MPSEPNAGRFSTFAKRFGIGVALVLELIVFSVLSPHFLTAENLLNVSLQASITAIIAAGMTFVILTGGIDLSVGSLVALAGVAATLVLKLDLPLVAGFSLAMVAGRWLAQDLVLARDSVLPGSISHHLL